MRREAVPRESSQFWNWLTPSPLGEGFYIPQSPLFPPQSSIYVPTSPPYRPVTPPPFFQPVLPPSPLTLPPRTFLLGSSPSWPQNSTLPIESSSSSPSQEVRDLPPPISSEGQGSQPSSMYEDVLQDLMERCLQGVLEGGGQGDV